MITYKRIDVKYEPFKLVGYIMNYAKMVAWNTDAEDFQDYWIWQFGPGPFKVVKAYEANVNGGYLGDIKMTYEAGDWIEFEVPDACEHFRVESRIKTVMFHSKWLTTGLRVTGSETK